MSRQQVRLLQLGPTVRSHSAFQPYQPRGGALDDEGEPARVKAQCRAACVKIWPNSRVRLNRDSTRERLTL